MSKSSDIADLLDHLELNDAFLAAQYPADIEDFCKVYPEKVIGLALVGPNETNSSAFEIIAERILMINSEHGPTKTAANDFKKDLKKASTYEIKNYEILPWSDISIDHPKQLFESLSNFFGSMGSKKNAFAKSKVDGKFKDTYFSIEGSGPPLILFPFTLSAAQWKPVIPLLAEKFTVITLSGPNLGFIPVLESRAALPTYQTMISSLVSIMNITPNGKILELGCGTGALCRQVLNLRQDISLTGVDINTYLLNGAIQIAENEDLHVNNYIDEKEFTEKNFSEAGELNFAYSDAIDIPFPDNFFDAVYSVTVLEECDADKAIKEIVRVVKPGGSIGIIVRAIDMPQWFNFDITGELKHKLNIPLQLKSTYGIADKSLYDQMRKNGLHESINFPSMVAVPRGKDKNLFEWFLRRTRQTLNADEKIELDVELSNISDKSNLIYSMPFHCSIGWKKS